MKGSTRQHSKSSREPKYASPQTGYSHSTHTLVYSYWTSSRGHVAHIMHMTYLCISTCSSNHRNAWQGTRHLRQDLRTPQSHGRKRCREIPIQRPSRLHLRLASWVSDDSHEYAENRQDNQNAINIMKIHKDKTSSNHVPLKKCEQMFLSVQVRIATHESSWYLPSVWCLICLPRIKGTMP